MSILSVDIILKKSGFSLDITCDIENQITGIFGPSGAGKTTFLRLINGLEVPDYGRISIQNRKVFDTEKKINISPEKRNIGYVFQDGKLFPHMNVAQNLRYGVKGTLRKQEFDEIIDLLQISEHLDKKISQISGGQAQRVAIGRALLASPDILMLDEPFSSLDKNLRHHVISLLKPLVKKFNIPLLVVSHDLSDLLMLSDRLLIIKDGKCAGVGSYLDLISLGEAFAAMNRSGLINTVELRLDRLDPEKGLMLLSKGEQRIFAETPTAKMGNHNNEMLNFFLRPEDITLALHKIKDISIQNQIEGVIQKIIISENKILCVIDHGFKLIAEVTLATQQNMNLREGTRIWSLFKAAALKPAHTGNINS